MDAACRRDLDFPGDLLDLPRKLTGLYVQGFSGFPLCLEYCDVCLALGRFQTFNNVFEMFGVPFDGLIARRTTS